jgi:hypothetical protein
MQRAPSPSTQKSDPAWSEQVAAAVRRRDDEGLRRLFSEPGARALVRGGFTLPLDGRGNTFIQLCMSAKNLDALRAVCTSAPDGITFHDCCVYDVTHPEGVSFYSQTPAHEYAVSQADAHALAVALEYEPDHPSTVNQLDSFNGATLHEHALFKATMSTDVQSAERFADCCQLLLARDKPLGARRAHMTAVDVLFGGRWCRDGIQGALVPLIGDYVRAGVIKLDEATPIGYPVAVAARAGNGYAAAAAIDLGCDVEAAARHAGVANIESLARAGNSIDLSNQAAALVIEALMRRRMREQSIGPARAPARRLRVGV